MSANPQFDDIIRAVSSTAMRRRFLVGLAALPLLGSDDADAWERERRGKIARSRKKNNKKRCAGMECGGKCRDCRDGKVCDGGVCVRPDGMAECDGTCVNRLTDADHRGACNSVCPGANGCRHGTCTSDPFHNACAQDNDGTGQCTCGAVVATPCVAACVDRNSRCDLDSPCFSDDCPARSVCLRGCSDPPTPPDPYHNPNRCSKPCN